MLTEYVELRRESERTQNKRGWISQTPWIATIACGIFNESKELRHSPQTLQTIFKCYHARSHVPLRLEMHVLLLSYHVHPSSQGLGVPSSYRGSSSTSPLHPGVSGCPLNGVGASPLNFGVGAPPIAAGVLPAYPLLGCAAGVGAVVKSFPGVGAS